MENNETPEGLDMNNVNDCQMIREEQLRMQKPYDKMTNLELIKAILGIKPGTRGKKQAEAVELSRMLENRQEPGNATPDIFQMAYELGKRFGGKKINVYLKPRDIWEEMRDIREQKREHFVVFFLDTRNQEISRHIVSIGTLNYNLVHPREVFEPAVKNLAASVIVAHNHPSGCLEPSDEDISLTKRLSQAGKLLGIELLDHVIVSKDGFMSFREKGLI